MIVPGLRHYALAFQNHHVPAANTPAFSHKYSYFQPEIQQVWRWHTVV
ncbi:hypothetical protein LJC21_04415 [Bacteroides sp. OttesenSCG-928-E20]|nr:hypothetical protein [Bacteroides sp. OttesenSCG-928-N06]MDL2299930.1 hypothetical protein [Bacteroides sp. OttesenSCG-928-E20]MDL2304524.1 hypothetical protein [Bacteroides sp. OttesenSCG-928-D19]